MGRYSRSLNSLSSATVSFFIWWVALRASKSLPSVQPLMVCARMTVGWPVCARAAVPAAGQAAQLVVGQVLHHLAQPGVPAEEILPDVRAGLHAVGLELAVRRGVHLVDQHAVGVLGQQRVPVAAPDDLDHVPAGAAEERLELLDDLAVAADRAVQPLQVAVDDEGEVVQFLAGGQPDRTERLGLVHLAVAEERPDVRPRGVVELAGQQVAVEPGLVDRVQRAEPHRHRGELPEIGHQPRVRVGRQPAARVREFLPESVELVLGQPALEEGAGVDARRRVTLEEHLVAGFAVVLAAEEVVEADLVERSRAGVGGDVPADAQAGPVRAGDHHGRVPPDIGPDPAFDVLVAGEPRLALRRDRVDEVGAAQAGHADLLLARPLEQAEHHVPGAGPASGAHDRIERLDPFARLVRVDVGQLGRQPVADDRELLTSGSHGVASPSAVSRAAGRPRERIPRCVVQTNRRTNWPIAHLYLTVTGPTGGFAPPETPKTGAGGGFAIREPPEPRYGGGVSPRADLVVTLRDESCSA